MADAGAAVEFLLKNLKQLLIYNAHLILDSKTQLQNLVNDLRLFKAFLKDSTKKRKKDETLSELVRQIRDVVYEVEDVIDALVTREATNYFKRAIFSPAKLLNVAKDVEKIGAKVRNVYDKNRIDFTSLVIDGGAAEDKIPEDKTISKAASK